MWPILSSESCMGGRGCEWYLSVSCSVEATEPRVSFSWVMDQDLGATVIPPDGDVKSSTPDHAARAISILPPAPPLSEDEHLVFGDFVEVLARCAVEYFRPSTVVVELEDRMRLLIEHVHSTCHVAGQLSPLKEPRRLPNKEERKEAAKPQKRRPSVRRPSVKKDGGGESAGASPQSVSPRKGPQRQAIALGGSSFSAMPAQAEVGRVDIVV